MREPNEFITVDFNYVDEFDNETRMCKTVDSDYLGETQLGVLLELFKDYLLCCGFTYLADKKIEFVDAD